MRAKVCSGILLAFFLSVDAMAQGNLSAQERSKSCDPAVATRAAVEILSDPRSLREPIEMFTPALVLFQHEMKDEALFWFYAAQLRSRYQLIFKQGDRGQLLQVMMGTVGVPINNYGFSDTQNLRRTLDRVLAWDTRTANIDRDGPQTTEQGARVAALYAEFHQLQDKVTREGPELERQAKQSAYLQSAMNRNAERCAPGRLDPSLVESEKRSEKVRVIEWVKSQPDVIRATGAIRAVTVDRAPEDADTGLPIGYSVYVQGERSTFAEVEVRRSGRETRLMLRCTNPVAPSRRDSRKDACAQ